MTGKFQRLYLEMFLKLQTLIPDFQPRHAISDFEQASISAIKIAFPEVQVQGCYCHFLQASMRNLGKHNLKSFYSNIKLGNIYFKMMFGISFLPVEKMDEVFDQITSIQIGNTTQQANISQFVRYFQCQWLGNKELIIFFNSNILTNNFSESLNSKLKSSFASHHTNYWIFVKKIKQCLRWPLAQFQIYFSASQYF